MYVIIFDARRTYELEVLKTCMTFSGVTEGGSCPRAQQVRGRKTAWPKIFYDKRPQN